MVIQFFMPDGNEIFFEELTVRKYKGKLLPGSIVQESKSEIGVLTVQELNTPLFTIAYNIFQIFNRIKLSIKERSGIRLQALLAGELYISSDGEEIKLSAGQYHLTEIPFFTCLFRKNAACNIFMAHYSKELLENLDIKVIPCSPQKMPESMADLIQEMLQNPYEEKLRDFYYENSVRELLFFHLSQGKASVPGELNDKDIIAIHEADAIISSDLNEHFTIEQLSRLAGTNQFKLKKGFRQVFDMGVFQRLLHKRMAHAKLLLQTTNKSIGEVADLAGYDTVAGFIHAFRKRFGMTPREWRNQQKE